ncbi:MAG TPA: ABC transporter permease subunit [Ktedonobacteraceae bacterium]
MLDIWAMYWKECKELYFQGNRAVLLFLLVVASLGIWLPFQVGQAWLDLPLIAVLLLAIGPVLFTFPFTADSFAGERERHTLESLLATSLSDGSIIAGKIAALLTMSWVMTLTSLLAGFAVANIHANGHLWSFYSPDRLLMTVLLSLTFSVLLITIGILISLRATTVRQAQQILGSSIAVLGLASSLLSTQLAHLPFVIQLQGFSEGEILPLMIGCTALLDVLLILFVQKRFQRSRLIL